MKPFYIPLYIKTTSFSDEKICIGMVYVKNEQLEFNFIEKKIAWAVQFTQNQSVGAVKRYCKLIQKKIDEVNTDFSLLKSLQEPLHHELYADLNKMKGSYIQWGALQVLDGNSESWKINKLFKKVVGVAIDGNVNKSIKIGFRKKVHQIMNKRTFDVFEKNYTFHPDELPGIYTQHKIDLVILKSMVMGVQFVDFTVSVSTIEKNIIQYGRIISGLKTYAINRDLPIGKFYIAYNTPKNQIQKALLARVEGDTNKQFELIRIQEVHKIL